MIILLSLGTATASENATDLTSADMESAVSGDVLTERTYTSSNVDLAVNVNVTPAYVDGKYNPVGSEVPWTITLAANGETAKNVKVLDIFSNNLQYISHNNTMGEYNPQTRTWTIGDLAPSETASLTVITKLKSAGTYVNKVYATSDSKEKNMLNNFVITSMKTGSPKVTSSVTETSDDRDGSQHTVHQASMGGAIFIIWNDKKEEAEEGGGEDPNPNPDPNPDPDPDPNKNPTGSTQQNSVSKTVTLENILTLGNNQTAENFNAIAAYDYSQIPILIFTIFLIILTAIVGYDKVKS
ncbi:MAG: DUF11 domain-containing protein [Methanobrevibacter sp.]|uniref:DUF11 domain-containing protein n=1 Tax=Methanobrevibacter sp. TaxID=66852 RepID=UPI0025DEE948|nr:DUF11 domain-containing protein [Methanobrevibacter sp.]MBQ6100445.1 DUF11 domain-containing protein [Methanobrevibacter sp.]